MSPRPYRMQKRQAQRDETRQRILEAARQLLSTDSSPDLSMEAVARRADVSRLTIYYQFGSRAGLLDALFDYLATRGSMQRMAQVFQEGNAVKAFEKMIETFVGFWSTDPTAIRRLRAIGALDAEIGEGIRARDARRPQIVREVLRRANANSGRRSSGEDEELAAVLGMLTSFESYDALARAGQSKSEIVATLERLARCAVEGPRLVNRRSASSRKS